MGATGHDRGHLASLLVDALRLIRVLRAEYRASADLLQIALEMLREREIEIDRLRDRYFRLIDERRAEHRRAA